MKGLDGPDPIAQPMELFFAGREQTAPGHAWGPGVRPYYLLHYVLRGQGRFWRAGKEYALSAGDAFLIRPGEVVRYEAGCQSPWEYCWAAFDGYAAGAVLQSCGLESAAVFHRGGEALREQMLRQTENFFREPGNVYLHVAGLYGMFACIAPARRPHRTSGEEYLEKAAAYIRRNYSGELRVRDVAAYVGVDRTYLYKLFAAHRGLSPQQYLLECRLHAARQYLLGSELTATEIAYSCGFASQAAFCRCFKSRYQMTPIQFRRAKRQEGRGGRKQQEG